MSQNLSIEDPIIIRMTLEPPVYMVPDPQIPQEPIFKESEAFLFETGDKAKLDKSVTSLTIREIITLSQQDYNDLEVKDPNVMYAII
jgi:hypothetical protein